MCSGLLGTARRGMDGTAGNGRHGGDKDGGDGTEVEGRELMPSAYAIGCEARVAAKSKKAPSSFYSTESLHSFTKRGAANVKQSACQLKSALHNCHAVLISADPCCAPLSSSLEEEEDYR